MKVAEIAQKIRADKDLGVGTCSHIDECLTEAELHLLISETIGEIQAHGRAPRYISIREVLYDKEVLWWEVEGITWPNGGRQ